MCSALSSCYSPCNNSISSTCVMQYIFSAFSFYLSSSSVEKRHCINHTSTMHHCSSLQVPNERTFLCTRTGHAPGACVPRLTKQNTHMYSTTLPRESRRVAECSLRTYQRAHAITRAITGTLPSAFCAPPLANSVFAPASHDLASCLAAVRPVPPTPPTA